MPKPTSTSIRTLLTDSRALATLAVPLVLTQLAQVALTTTDTIMMGLMGAEALAAGGLAMYIPRALGVLVSHRRGHAERCPPCW